MWPYARHTSWFAATATAVRETQHNSLLPLLLLPLLFASGSAGEGGGVHGSTWWKVGQPL
jgi:hypothetical protein